MASRRLVLSEESVSNLWKQANVPCIPVLSVRRAGNETSAGADACSYQRSLNRSAHNYSDIAGTGQIPGNGASWVNIGPKHMGC